MTKNAWWAIGGVGAAGLAIGTYYLIKNRKKKEDEMPVISTLSSGKPTKINRGGSTSPLVEPNWKAPFDMNYLQDVKKWLRGKRIQELSKSQANQFALILKNAKGLFDDDEDAVGGVFRSLQDKTQVASLSWAFYHNHGQKDLYKYLKSFLSDQEMKTLILQPINKLPNYRLA